MCPTPAAPRFRTDGTPLLPIAPLKAVEQGSFQHVATLFGANRDEGRTFRQGDIGWQEADYTKWVDETFAAKADKVLAEYPWPKTADTYTGAYLSGAIVTDSGLIGGIGGCSSLKLMQDFSKYAPVYAYEFGHRNGPGLTREHGAYQWGAGHAAELAYLFPSFNNGEPIAPLFNEGERSLASSMKSYWGAFVKQGVPSDKNGVCLAPVQRRGAGSVAPGRRRILRALDGNIQSSEHDCEFWEAD